MKFGLGDGKPIVLILEDLDGGNVLSLTEETLKEVIRVGLTAWPNLLKELNQGAVPSPK